MRRRDPQRPPVFLGREAVAEGFVTPAQLRGGSVQRVLPGVYTLAGVQVTHELRREAAGLVIPPEAQVTGASLATVLGVPLLDRLDPVEVVLPEQAHRSRVRGIEQRRVVVPVGPPVDVLGRAALAHPYRMGFDLAVGRRPAEAVARLDAVANAGLLDLDGFRSYLASRQERGVVGVRRAAELADARSESQPESRLRVLLVGAGIAVTPQVVVTTGSGAFVARVDLAVDGFLVAVEYDGAWHGAPGQLDKDRARLNALGVLGWEVVHVTAATMRDGDALVAMVRAAVARARRRP